MVSEKFVVMLSVLALLARFTASDSKCELKKGFLLLLPGNPPAALGLCCSAPKEREDKLVPGRALVSVRTTLPEVVLAVSSACTSYSVLCTPTVRFHMMYLQTMHKIIMRHDLISHSLF